MNTETKVIPSNEVNEKFQSLLDKDSEIQGPYCDEETEAEFLPEWFVYLMGEVNENL